MLDQLCAVGLIFCNLMLFVLAENMGLQTSAIYHTKHAIQGNACITTIQWRKVSPDLAQLLPASRDNAAFHVSRESKL